MASEFVKVTDKIYFFSGEQETDRPFLYYIKGSDYSVAIDAGQSKEHVEQFYSAIQKEGFSIRVTSAYRSIEDQQKLYNKFLLNDPAEVVDETCARPCYSEHHTGLAVDVEGSIKGGRNWILLELLTT